MRQKITLSSCLADKQYFSKQKKGSLCLLKHEIANKKETLNRETGGTFQTTVKWRREKNQLK